MAQEQRKNSLPYRPCLQPKRDFYPKESISALRKWLYTNRYSPYASNEDKMQLVRMTNLSLRQISVWLTNARRFQLPQWIRDDGKDPDEYTLSGQRRKIARQFNWTLASPGPRKRSASFAEMPLETVIKEEATETETETEIKTHTSVAEEEYDATSATETTVKEEVPEQQEECEELLENHRFGELYLLSEVAVAVQRYEAHQRRNATR